MPWGAGWGHPKVRMLSLGRVSERRRDPDRWVVVSGPRVRAVVVGQVEI